MENSFSQILNKAIAEQTSPVEMKTQASTFLYLFL